MAGRAGSSQLECLMAINSLQIRCAHLLVESEAARSRGDLKSAVRTLRDLVAADRESRRNCRPAQRTARASYAN